MQAELLGVIDFIVDFRVLIVWNHSSEMPFIEIKPFLGLIHLKID
jgi:hypothetical protein